MKTKTLLTMIAIFCTINLFGQIIHVPNDYLSIQAGINAAGDGDTVLVADGAYLENINFKGKAITVASHYLVDGNESHIDNTIIDGSQPDDADSASVVMFVSGEDTTSILYGLTITGGSGIAHLNSAMRVGGGISIYFSGAKILKNRIVQNSVEISEVEIEMVAGGGIGVIADYGDHWVVIEDNVISGNAVSTSDFYQQIAQGGGIYTTSDARISNNVIHNNESYGSLFSLGAGAYFKSADTELLRTIYFSGNDMQYNSAEGDEWVFGGGIYALTCHMYIENNIVSYNTVNAGFRGISGGMTLFTYFGGELYIINNEIVGNECHAVEDVWGTAINFSHALDKVKVIGNNISGNIGTAGGTAYGTISIYIDISQADYFTTEYIIEGNKFINNQIELGGALCIFNSENSKITNNLFAGNIASNGGAIDLYKGALKAGSPININENTNSVVVNNTFAFNHVDENGGAIRNNFDSDKLLTFNNVYWENTAEDGGDDIYYYGEGQGMFIAYSHLDESKISGSWNGWGNVFADPMIQNDSLHLSGGSSCLNTGTDSIEFNYITYHCPQTDIEGDARPMYGGVDIGADEYFVVGIEPTIASNEVILEIFPNPFRNQTSIKFNLDEPSQCSIEVFNSFGEKVETITQSKLEQGTHQIQWRSADLPDGIYHIRLIAGGITTTTKVLHLN